MQTENLQTDLSQSPAVRPSLWAEFSTSSGSDYFMYWLALQASLMPAAMQGVLVVHDTDSDSYQPVAVWPDTDSNPARLADICESTLEQRCGLLARFPAVSGDAPTEGRYAISYPVFVDTSLRGVVAFEVATASEPELNRCKEHLQWGAAWIELYFRRAATLDAAEHHAGMVASFDLMAAVLTEQRFDDAAMVFVTELATMLHCDRVSLGFMKDHQMRLAALSHSASFGKQMNLIRYITAAMEESVLQRGEVVFPLLPGANLLVTRDHEELARQQGGEALLTLPLHADDRYYGAITLERPADLPFQEDEVRICRGILALVAPVLEAKRLNDRLLIQKTADSFRQQLHRFFGKGYYGRKLLVLLLSGLIVLLCMLSGEYRLSATTTLEPLVRRSVVSPFNGYVKDASVRSGDLVKRGAILCSLDARDLYLERSKWQNQQVQYERQRQEALATNDRAKANIITSQLDQAKAQLDLVHNQLRRTTLVAPFDGIVVNGDLSQRIDGAVEQGEVLFELAPLNAYRLILQVDEYRIADIRLGQKGTLVLPALLDRHFEFEVTKITPISSQKEGKNYFRVEARLLRPSDVLRPGMEGVGKVTIDRRKLVSVWTRDLVDWLRVSAWRWWP